MLQPVDAQSATDDTGERGGRHVLHQRIDGWPAVTRVVGKETRAGVAWKIALQFPAGFVRQLAMGQQEGEWLQMHRGVRAIKTRGIKQDSGVHTSFNSM